MRRIADKLPLNARVSIDYSTGDVSFDYPDERNHRTQIYMVLVPILLAWVIVNCTLFAVYILIDGLHELASNPELQQQIYTNVTSTSDSKLDYDMARLYLLGLAWLFTPPYVATRYIVANYERFMVSFPKFNYWFLHKVLRYKEYIVRENSLDDTTYELPIFKNIMLNYETEGEFANYLQRVDIEEIQYLREKRNGEEKKVNIYWKAVFTFTQPPRNGKLEVRFI